MSQSESAPPVLYESKSVASWAYALAALFAAIGIGVTGVLLSTGGAEGLFGLLLVLAAFFVANFAVLTVRVTEDEVAWSFGWGWIGRHVPLSRVRSAEPARSPWYWGWGIRWTPRGWLWRSHGLDVVWLELDSGKSVGIGTQDPQGFASAVRERL